MRVFRFTSKKTMLVICVTSLFAMIGCARQQVPFQGISYNQGIADFGNKQILLNIVRAAKRMPLYFNVIGNFTAGDAVNAKAGTSLPFVDHIAGPFTGTSSVELSSGIKSFEVQNVTTKKFVTGLQKEISEDHFKLLQDRNRNKEFLFNMLIDRINIRLDHAILFMKFVLDSCDVESKSEISELAEKQCEYFDPKIRGDKETLKLLRYVEYFSDDFKLSKGEHELVNAKRARAEQCGIEARSILSKETKNKGASLRFSRHVKQDFPDHEVMITIHNGVREKCQLRMFQTVIKGFIILDAHFVSVKLPCKSKQCLTVSQVTKLTDGQPIGKGKIKFSGPTSKLNLLLFPGRKQKKEEYPLNSSGSNSLAEGIRLRTPRAIFEYLGDLMVAQTHQQPSYSAHILDVDTFKKVNLFKVNPGPGIEPDSLTIDQGGTVVNVPAPVLGDGRNHTSFEAVSLLKLLIDLQTEDAQIPKSTQIVVQ